MPVCTRLLTLSAGQCYLHAMTATAFKSTTEEAAIREAGSFGAAPGEARKIHELVRANTNLNVVRGFELRFGRDAADNEAVWVHLVVEEDLNPTAKKISSFNEVAKKVQTALLQANLRFWPYVDVRGRLDAPQ